MIEPQEAYTKALKQRFLEMREKMHSSPDEAALATLDKKFPMTFNTSDKKAYASWHRVLMTTTPHPAQIQSLDVDVVVREELLAETTSVWIWSLLARLDDVGTMNNDEVYAIREFGKKAVLVQVSMHDPEAAALLEQAQRDAEAEHVFTNGSAAGVVANGHELADEIDKLHSQKPDLDSPGAVSTLATLDMILAIVGELFGQRDLLEFRRQWEVAEDKADRSIESAAHDYR
ncbi:hypothetical protein LTR57_017162 [Friedmanniomyces endolithicus]|nr:hypothetical protein LTR57_017162 [Friedmanniomyces endolithicus]